MGDITKQWRSWAKAVQYPDLVDVNRIEACYRDLSAKSIQFLEWLNALSVNHSLLATLVTKEEYEGVAITNFDSLVSDSDEIDAENVEESLEELTAELRYVQNENLRLREKLKVLKDRIEKSKVPEEKAFDQDGHIKYAEHMDQKLLEKATEITQMMKPGRRLHCLRDEIERICETEVVILREAASATSGHLVMGTSAGQISAEHAHARGEQELQRLHEAKTKLLELSFDARMANARADGEMKFRRKWVGGYNNFSAPSPQRNATANTGDGDDENNSQFSRQQLGQPNLKKIKELIEETQEEIAQLKQKLFDLMELRPTLVNKSTSAKWLQKQNSQLRSCIASQEFVLKVLKEQGERYQAFRRGQEHLLEHLKVQISTVDACVHFAELSNRNCEGSREYLHHVMEEADGWTETKKDLLKWTFRERGRDSLAYALTQTISDITPAAIPESATAASSSVAAAASTKGSALRRSAQSLSPIRGRGSDTLDHTRNRRDNSSTIDSPMRCSTDTHMSMKSMMPNLSALSPARPHPYAPQSDAHTPSMLRMSAESATGGSIGDLLTVSVSFVADDTTATPARQHAPPHELGRVITYADALSTVQSVCSRKGEAIAEVTDRVSDLPIHVAGTMKICEDLRRASGFVKLPKSLKLKIDEEAPVSSSNATTSKKSTSSAAAVTASDTSKMLSKNRVPGTSTSTSTSSNTRGGIIQKFGEGVKSTTRTTTTVTTTSTTVTAAASRKPSLRNVFGSTDGDDGDAGGNDIITDISATDKATSYRQREEVVEVATVTLREALLNVLNENASLQRSLRQRAKALISDMTEKTTSVKELNEGRHFAESSSPRGGSGSSPRSARSSTKIYRGGKMDTNTHQGESSTNEHGPRERRLFPLFSACDKDAEALAALRRELIR